MTANVINRLNLIPATNEKTPVSYNGGLNTDHSTIVNMPQNGHSATANTPTNTHRIKSVWSWQEAGSNGNATKPKRELPPIVSLRELDKEDIKEPTQLVEGWIDQGTKIAIGGASKSKKTWTLLYLALCVGHGCPFLGRKTNKGKVLIVNLEVSKSYVRKRLRAIAAKMNPPVPIDTDEIDIWNLRGHAASHETLLPLIQERIKQDYALVIIDPIYKVYGKMDENSAGDVAQLMNSFEYLAVETTAAVAFSAHFSKGQQGGKESIDRISGSGVFARDPDTLLIFTAHEEPDCFSVEPTLRNFPPFEPFTVRWQYPLMVPDENLDPTRLKKKGAPKKHSPEKLLKLLPPEGMSNAEWKKLAARNGMDHNAFQDLRKKLEDDGLVTGDVKLWKPAK